MSGGLAVCAFVITGFALMILWGRTSSGKRTLVQWFGEPTPPKPAVLPSRAKRNTSVKVSPTSATAKPKTSTRLSSNPASSTKKKPAPRAK